MPMVKTPLRTRKKSRGGFPSPISQDFHQAAVTSMYGETMSNKRKAPIFFVFTVGALEHGKPEQTPQESASAQGRKPAVNEPDTTGASCHVDSEEGGIANCLYQTATGQLLVAPGIVKYGFANRQGQRVIPPIYSCNFEKGTTRVCKGCESKRFAAGGCEHRFFSGGEWFRIDAHRTSTRIKPVD